MARRRIESWCGAALAVLVVVQPLALAAAEHLVRMRTETEAGRFRFEPALVFVEPGDDVRFVPDTRLHGVKSIAGMLPAGATRWRGRMGAEMLVRFNAPGVYGFKCIAHYEVGMVGLVVVGANPLNWRTARSVRHPPMASEAFDALFTAAACRLPPPANRDCRPPAQ